MKIKLISYAIKTDHVRDFEICKSIKLNFNNCKNRIVLER